MILTINMQLLAENLKNLGLNDKQCKTYEFTLLHKKVNPTTIAKYLKITQSRATRMLREMKDKGFLKTYFSGRERYYFPCDIKELENNLLDEVKEKENKLVNSLKSLKSELSSKGIKTYSYESETMKEAFEKELRETKNTIYEYVNLGNAVDLKPSKVIQDKEMITLYSSKKNFINHGVKIENNNNQNYAHLVSFDNKVSFVTSNKENVIIENPEIANTIKLIINKASQL